MSSLSSLSDTLHFSYHRNIFTFYNISQPFCDVMMVRMVNSSLNACVATKVWGAGWDAIRGGRNNQFLDGSQCGRGRFWIDSQMSKIDFLNVNWQRNVEAELGSAEVRKCSVRTPFSEKGKVNYKLYCNFYCLGLASVFSRRGPGLSLYVAHFGAEIQRPTSKIFHWHSDPDTLDNRSIVASQPAES